MKVTITKKHCENATYMSTTDCPLARALREAGVVFSGVQGWAVRVGDTLYGFNGDYYSGWTMFRMYEIQKGIINSFTVDIPTLN